MLNVNLRLFSLSCIFFKFLYSFCLLYCISCSYIVHDCGHSFSFGLYIRLLSRSACVCEWLFLFHSALNSLSLSLFDESVPFISMFFFVSPYCVWNGLFFQVRWRRVFQRVYMPIQQHNVSIALLYTVSILVHGWSHWLEVLNRISYWGCFQSDSSSHLVISSWHNSQVSEQYMFSVCYLGWYTGLDYLFPMPESRDFHIWD